MERGCAEVFAETSVETNEFSFIADATIMRVDNSYSCGSAACHCRTDFSRSLTLSRDKNVNATSIGSSRLSQTRKGD